MVVAFIEFVEDKDGCFFVDDFCGYFAEFVCFFVLCECVVEFFTDAEEDLVGGVSLPTVDVDGVDFV